VPQLPKSCSLAPSEGAARAAGVRELARRVLRTRERDDACVLLRYRAADGAADAAQELAEN
jgi:hypothetical protein